MEDFPEVEKSILAFEGGPIDGTSISIDGDWLGVSFQIDVPKKGGATRHEYVAYCLTMFDGQATATVSLVYTGAKNVKDAVPLGLEND